LMVPAVVTGWIRFYEKVRQLPLPFQAAADQNLIERPLALIYYFHQRRLGVSDLDNTDFPTRDIQFSQELCTKYGDLLCREFIDYALGKAKDGSFNVQTLSGIRQYLNEFLATRAERDRKAAQHAIADERLQKEAALKREKEGYEHFFNMEIKRIREKLPPEELEALEEPLRAQFRQLYPGSQVGVGMFVYLKGNQILQQRYRIPTFEQWQVRPQA